jgi:hypothetical protein
MPFPKQIIYKLRKMLFFGVLLMIIYAYFFQTPVYKKVNEIDSRVSSPPVQVEVSNREPITFIKDGYSYSLEPLYEYTLSGLVVSQLKYDRWFSLSRTDKAFVKDLCVIWGDNLQTKSYQDRSFRVKQDFRFCMYQHSGKLDFRGRELSNNHLIVSNPMIERVIKEIRTGDQIVIKGYLVNVDARALGKTERYEAKNITWQTSVTREDSGAGACEVIYVTDARIIKRAGFFDDLRKPSLIGFFIVVGLYVFLPRKPLT